MTKARASLGSARMAMIVLTIVASLHAQQAAPARTQARPPLTAQDYLDIQQLVARYAYAMDSGADNGFAYADLFTPDGEFVAPGGTIRGREALAEIGRAHV